MAPDVMRDGQPHRGAGQPDLDAGQIERVEHQPHLATDQCRVDFVAIAV
jgi:hypothetical protein